MLSTEISLESDPVALAVVDLNKKKWEGTTTGLLEMLSNQFLDAVLAELNRQPTD